ncbi:RsmD family RNA methyltransferase [Endomicrobium proavitum]|uniref:Putative N6-adenine-specific methylase n=1 Tax=Endomicrobium proavitum TaxID=1408281 RepID=A0A0G3WIL7_9BACT|nr:RsmD family RNA methyltransferase [Endomicrobium proavitum]AKL98153.1 putative N6-adenine-specific methylase [Endomicrobium proavitum]
MLKVLAGDARGRVLKTLPQDDLSIRPMLGRMKKSVFDIIQFRIPNCDFLDLFAGVGSVGIEALSRGAKSCVFAEISKVSLGLIKHNVGMLNYNDRARIVRCDVIREFDSIVKKYDIVFMGPPYKDGDKKALALTMPALKNVVRYDVLKEDSVLIAQKHIKEPVGHVAGLDHFRTEKYGDTVVLFYRRAK